MLDALWLSDSTPSPVEQLHHLQQIDQLVVILLLAVWPGACEFHRLERFYQLEEVELLAFVEQH